MILNEITKLAGLIKNFSKDSAIKSKNREKKINNEVYNDIIKVI